MEPVFSAPDILAVRFSAIGDILLTTPLLRALRAANPGARITVLTKSRFAPLLSHNPHLNEVIGIGKGKQLLFLRILYFQIFFLQGYLHLHNCFIDYAVYFKFLCMGLNSVWPLPVPHQQVINDI